MNILNSNRRIILAGTATFIGASAMRLSVAQTAAEGADWMAMVKAQHLIISKAFDKMQQSRSSTYLQRANMQRAIAYLLTAHSVAEENVLYPAIAARGMVSESDKLYLDQAHAKVMTSALELSDIKDETGWFAKLAQLQAAVLKHAKEDEEAVLYPRLLTQLSAAESEKLTMAYQREFGSVSPAPRTLAA